MGFKAFYKIATSAAETNPVVTWGTTSAPGAAVAVSYQKAATESWVTPSGNGGGDATARTSQTSTIASHIAVKTGDLVDFFRGQCDDSGALTVPTITQTGVTYNAVTEYPATALLDGTSNDIAADGGYRTATAGTSSAAAVVTGTSAASEQHGAWMTRLRVDQVATLPVLGGNAYATECAADSPNVALPMGESSGNPQDVSGNARHVTVVGGTPTYGVTGPVAGTTAIAFDGATEYFTVPDSAGTDLGDVFTYEAWIARGGATGLPQCIIGKGNSNTPQIRLYDTGEINFLRSGVAEFCTSTSTVPGTGLHHIVGTKSGADVHLYIDAVDVTGTVTNSTCTNNNDVLSIGALVGTPSDFFSGTIGQVRIYPTALSPARVAAHYQAGINAVAPLAVLYAPTLAQVGAQSITPPLLDASPALYAPTVTPKNTVTIGLLDASPALYAPTLLTKNTVTLALLTSTSALYAPTIAPQPVTITLGSIDAAPALYAPNVSASAALPLIDAANAVYAPTLGATYALTPPLLDSGPAVYAPNISLTIDAPFIDAANALYAPSFAVGPVTVTLGLLDAAPALYAPALSVTLAVPLLDASPELYAPDLIQDQFVTLDLLDAGPDLYEPAFSGAGTIVLQLLDSGPELYAPTLSPQPVGITLGLLTTTSALYAPTIAVIGGNQSVTLPSLTSARGLFAPVLSGPDTSLPEYEPMRLYRTPARGTVKLPVLASRASLYAPTLAVDDDDEIFAMLAYA
jgi:hypothetical protein